MGVTASLHDQAGIMSTSIFVSRVHEDRTGARCVHPMAALARDSACNGSAVLSSDEDSSTGRILRKNGYKGKGKEQKLGKNPQIWQRSFCQKEAFRAERLIATFKCSVSAWQSSLDFFDGICCQAAIARETVKCVCPCHRPFLKVNTLALGICWRNQEQLWMNSVIVHWSYGGLRQQKGDHNLHHQPSNRLLISGRPCQITLQAVGQNILSSQILKA